MTRQTAVGPPRDSACVPCDIVSDRLRGVVIAYGSFNPLNPFSLVHHMRQKNGDGIQFDHDCAVSIK